MNDYLTNPHDKFFKDLFSRQEAARDFLQHFLPAEVSKLLDLDTLVIQKDSFIDPDLHEQFSDLLYQVQLHGGQQIHIYLLFEHKSYPDPDIALQLLGYMDRIWQQARRQGTALLPVLPLVLYHGAKRWHIAPQFSRLFDLPEELRPYFPDYQYWLCDLSQYSDEALKQTVTLRAQLLVLKYILRADFGPRFIEMVALLRQLLAQERGMEQVYTLLKYVARATEQLAPQTFMEVVEAIFTETGENPMPTIVEQWLEQGRVEGRVEGREEGREEGQREATLTILRRYLATRFNIDLHHFDTDLTPLDLPALTTLSEHAFTATTLAEFEAALAEITAGSPSEQPS